jgi:hypothetical protein
MDIPLLEFDPIFEINLPLDLPGSVGPAAASTSGLLTEPQRVDEQAKRLGVCG